MDVVVAPATAWGHAALAVVRLSGLGLDEVLGALVRPLNEGPLRAGRPRRVLVVDGDVVIDDGVLVLGRGPRTYTGEDTAEITCHGNPIVVEQVVEAAIRAGARLAEPGELTRRALLNGKIDLVRAEAVLQLGRARSARGVALARRGLDGGLGGTFDVLRERLLGLTAECEARLDHPDDDLALIDDMSLLGELGAIGEAARELAASWEGGRRLVEGARVALVGAVNAGKSSLFNALLGRERALVHATEGTTRDVLEVSERWDGVAITLLDTAGERATEDPVEAAGLALARELVAEADLLVVVLRAGPEGPSETERAILARTFGLPRVVVLNGVDRDHAPVDGALSTSALRGEGIEALRKAILRSLVDEEPGAVRERIASVRQRDRLLEVARCVDEAIEAFDRAGVAVAADALTRAIEAVDALTGADTREDVLDALFARFCIGK